MRLYRQVHVRNKTKPEPIRKKKSRAQSSARKSSSISNADIQCLCFAPRKPNLSLPSLPPYPLFHCIPSVIKNAPLFVLPSFPSFYSFFFLPSFPDQCFDGSGGAFARSSGPEMTNDPRRADKLRRLLFPPDYGSHAA